jgi:hypothetical protein
LIADKGVYDTMIGSVQSDRRKVGVASAIILASSAVASFVSVLVYAQGLPELPKTSILILALTTLLTVAAAIWLGRKIWIVGSRWPATALLAWSLMKQINPDFLYPNALPKFLYLAALVGAIMVLVPAKTMKSGNVR